MATAVEVEAFSPESYRLDVPTLDGHKAARCQLRFSGAGELDRTSADDVALMQAARLGEEVRLIVVGKVSTKSFTLKDKKDGESLQFTFSVQVSRVEAAETA